MKKVFLSLGVAVLSVTAAMAQDARKGAEQVKTSALSVENMSFTNDSHAFGTVSEGPTADYEFQFKNTGKEPIVIQRVQASCGCTTPSYTKEPVAPGKSGIIKASYNTMGRPGEFTKTLTVVSNAGTKVLTISGTVEKAPTTSVPENSSMIRTN